MVNLKDNDITFEHLIDLPGSDGVFASTLVHPSRRRRLFLMSNDTQRIFKRNAIKETWEELSGSMEYESVRQGFFTAIEERRIPCYQAQDLDIFRSDGWK